MVAFGVNRLGADKGTGDVRALFLKRFAGEVLTEFNQHAVTAGRVRTRTLTNGKSASFPLMGAIDAKYHTPGENIIEEGGGSPSYLQKPKHSEKVIHIDGFLIAPILIAQIDEAMNHYEIRGPYARKMAWALARQFDVNVMWTMASGCDTGTSSGAIQLSGDKSDWGKAGSMITDDDFNSNLASCKATLLSIAQKMDENDVPEMSRHVALQPSAYYLLADDDDIVSADFNAHTGGSRGKGGQAQLTLYGLNLHKTNRIGDLQAQGAAHAQQFGIDYTQTTTVLGKTQCLAWQENESVGVVRLKDLGVQSQYMVQYLATFMVAGFAVGHGVLHQSACFGVRVT